MRAHYNMGLVLLNGIETVNISDQRLLIPWLASVMGV